MRVQSSEIRLDDALMVASSLAGDLNAYNQLVLAYQDMAYNTAYRILGEKTSAEDVVQDAFLSAYRKLNSFHGGSYKAWLLRIVVNRCYDEIRRRNRRPSISLYPLDENNEEIESPRWLEDPGETPEEATVFEELSGVIQKCLNALSADFRKVVVLVDFLEMSYAEASEVAGVPLGTIKSRLKRAREQLRGLLKRYGDVIPEAYPNKM
jgi:RNA polymerase sigma-70 factor (ECF subfamily)